MRCKASAGEAEGRGIRIPQLDLLPWDTQGLIQGTLRCPESCGQWGIRSGNWKMRHEARATYSPLAEGRWERSGGPAKGAACALATMRRSRGLYGHKDLIALVFFCIKVCMVSNKGLKHKFVVMWPGSFQGLLRRGISCCADLPRKQQWQRPGHCSGSPCDFHPQVSGSLCQRRASLCLMQLFPWGGAYWTVSWSHNVHLVSRVLSLHAQQGTRAVSRRNQGEGSSGGQGGDTQAPTAPTPLLGSILGPPVCQC